MAENKMREIRIDKVTLNIGSGPDPKNVEKGLKLLETISNMKAVEAKARARIATWKIRPIQSFNGQRSHRPWA